MISALANNVHLYSCTQLVHSFMQIFFTTNWIFDLIFFKIKCFLAPIFLRPIKKNCSLLLFFEVHF